MGTFVRYVRSFKLVLWCGISNTLTQLKAGVSFDCVNSANVSLTPVATYLSGADRQQPERFLVESKGFRARFVLVPGAVELLLLRANLGAPDF